MPRARHTAALAAALAALAAPASPQGPATTIRARLLTPVSSAHSKVGDRVEATVLGLPGAAAPVPRGCTLVGRVQQADEHDGDADRRAELVLAFERVRDAAGDEHPAAFQVTAVENGCEDVDDDGRILGPRRLRALPPRREDLLMLAAYAHPLVLAAVEGSRLALGAARPSQIQLARATTLILADRTGGNVADGRSLRSDVRTFLAVADDQGYRQGPVSLLTLDGVPPALVFEQQTNTYAKRHHIRLWPATGAAPGGETAWVGAATHDIGIEFSHASRHYTHLIAPAIDDERASLLMDLVATGLVPRYALVERAGVPARSVNAAGDPVVTDGRVAVVWIAPGTVPK